MKGDHNFVEPESQPMYIKCPPLLTHPGSQLTSFDPNRFLEWACYWATILHF